MQNHNYQHSIAFEKLKSLRETVTTNYTSLQYLQTLDHFLVEALKPISRECPELFKSYIAKIVARQTLKSSSKFTSNDRTKLPVLLFNSIMAAPDRTVSQVEELHINRGLYFGFISWFLQHLKEYKDLHKGAKLGVETRSQCYAMERSVALRHKGDLYGAILEVEYWSNKAREWKEQIVEKYTRMAILQAQSTYKDYGHRVSLDDICQIYLMVVSRAIDRCDSRHGVITTFVQNWFKSAKSEVAKLAGEPTDQSYDSLVEEHGDGIHDILGSVDPDNTTEIWQHVSYVACKIDKAGLVRTKLGIPQYVSIQHRNLLEQFVDESFARR